MLNILIIIAPLFLIILASAAVQHFKKLDKNWGSILNSYALNIGFPALIFSALSNITFSFDQHSNIIIINSIFLITGFFISYFAGKILKFSNKIIKTIFISFIFGNVAYLGIPVITQVYGSGTIGITSLIVAVYLFWVFTIGIGFLDYSQIKKGENLFKNIIANLIKNPLLIAVCIGLLVSLFSINIPTIVSKSISMIASSVTPIVLIVIGLFIGKTKIGKLLEWIPVLIFSLAILIILPGILYFGIKLFGLQTNDFTSSIIEASMPLAITPFALADKYNLDKKFIANSIVLSTVLSIITIPFWIGVLGN